MRRLAALAALIIGVATAQPVQNYYGNADPHVDAACRRPTYSDRYVVMLSAFEQMNNKPSPGVAYFP